VTDSAAKPSIIVYRIAICGHRGSDATSAVVRTTRTAPERDAPLADAARRHTAVIAVPYGAAVEISPAVRDVQFLRPTGKPMPIVGNEISGTTTIYQVDCLED